MKAVRNEFLKTNVVKRQVILADGTMLRNEQIPARAGAAKRDDRTNEVVWLQGWELRFMDRPERIKWSCVKTFKPGKNITDQLNAWTIGWCFVVADSPISKAAAKAANKAVGMASYSEVAGRCAWPYLVGGVQCDVMTDHAGSLARAAEKGRLMADALLKHGITSRVYVMTDKQFGLAYLDGDTSERARHSAKLKGLRLTSVEDTGRCTNFTLTEKQSIPVYQTSL